MLTNFNFYIFPVLIFLSSCINKDYQLRTNDCQIISKVYKKFLFIHQNEFKHTKLNKFYICNFDNLEIDPSISIQDKPTFLPGNKVSFDELKLMFIAHQCIGDSTISFIDHVSAQDMLKNGTDTDKAIWGITNYSKNREYCYLVFGCYLSQRAIVADEYLLKLNGDSLEILEINPILH